MKDSLSELCSEMYLFWMMSWSLFVDVNYNPDGDGNVSISVNTVVISLSPVDGLIVIRLWE